MSYVDKEDGLKKLSMGEHYKVSGDVTIKIHIRYTTNNEPGEDNDDMWDAIKEVVGDDFDIVDTDDLDYEVERNEE